jgi:hypothetical protein
MCQARGLLSVWGMKKLILALVCTAVSPLAFADLYNQNVTAIYGSGNPDAGWTTDTASGITLALRAKNRTTGATPNVNGVYSFATGVVPPANNRAIWNYEFSVNSGGSFLNAYDYYLSIDTDASQGVSFTTINALTVFGDNSYGTAVTLNGQGVEGPAATYAGSNSVAQNSQNIVFIGLNPYLDATYNYQLFAVAAGAGAQGARLNEVDMTVVVGAGGAAVPDAASSSLLIGLGLAALACARLRRRA